MTRALKAIRDRISGFSHEQKGQGMVEYAVIIALVSIAALLVLGALGIQIGEVFQQIVDALTF